MSQKKISLRSILLVDDSEASLQLYGGLLRKHTKAHVMCTTMPSVALKWANQHFYDIILIDVTINYHGTQFGGLEIYKTLLARYGSSSLIVYSQFITDDFLRNFGEDINFIEKKVDPKKFIVEVIKLMNDLRKSQTCFVAMPFAAKYNSVFNVIKNTINHSYYRCMRIDQQQFNKSIVDKIFSEIQNAKMIIFLANDHNSNAFYECGYSVALGKEIITIIDSFTNLPFDIRDRNAIAYGDDFEILKKALTKKVSTLTKIP